jgi:hypothetical protein
MGSSLENLSVHGEERLSDPETHRSVHLWREAQCDHQELVLDLDDSTPDGLLHVICMIAQDEHPARGHDPKKREVGWGMMGLLPCLESRAKRYILARKCRLWALGEGHDQREVERGMNLSKVVDRSVRAIGRGEDWNRNDYSWRQIVKCLGEVVCAWVH